MESTDPKLAKISTALDKGYLSIRAGKSWYILITKTIDLVIWFVGIVVMLRLAHLNGIVLTMYPFVRTMLPFILFGLGMSIALLWGFFGKEVLTIKNKQVLLNKHIFGLGITYVLEKSAIADIQFNKVYLGGFFGYETLASWGLGRGKVKILVKRKEVYRDIYSFGLGFKDEEAMYLVEKLKEKICL